LLQTEVAQAAHDGLALETMAQHRCALVVRLCLLELAGGSLELSEGDEGLGSPGSHVTRACELLPGVVLSALFERDTGQRHRACVAIVSAAGGERLELFG